MRIPKFDGYTQTPSPGHTDPPITLNKGIEQRIKKNKTKEKKVPSQVRPIFEHWQKVMNHPRAKLDDKRRRKIKSALANYSAQDVIKAIDGCKSSSWHQENGVDDLELVLRDAEHIEKFIRNANSGDMPDPTKALQDCFAGRPACRAVWEAWYEIRKSGRENWVRMGQGHAVLKYFTGILKQHWSRHDQPDLMKLDEFTEKLRQESNLSQS